MPGASPTMSNAAFGSPNDGTGALNQPGSRRRVASRNSTSLGQSGQLRSGSRATMSALVVTGRPAVYGIAYKNMASIVEIFVVAPGRHGGGALQELRRVRRVMARFA